MNIWKTNEAGCAKRGLSCLVYWAQINIIVCFRLLDEKKGLVGRKNVLFY